MKTSGVISVLSVDDHPMIRQGIAAAIDGVSDMKIAAEAANGEEAIQAFRRYRPDITLLDLQMPVMSGMEALKVIRSEFPSARIIVLTDYEGDVQAVRALRAGAQGCLLKSMLRKDLLDTIRAVNACKRCVPPAIAERMAAYFEQDALTERETDILRLISNGLSNKLAAQQLSVSEDTVKSHMKTILSKLGANDRTHAVTIALKRGFLDG